VAGTAVEIGCTGRDNGWGTAGAGTHNGSTSHGGYRVVRVGGTYCRSNGPNVADVGAETAAWLIGCAAWDSNAASMPDSQQNVNFLTQCTGAGGTWLDGCWGHHPLDGAARYNLAANAAGARLFVRAMQGVMTVLRDPAAGVISY
jgi:hypothetical protein